MEEWIPVQSVDRNMTFTPWVLLYPNMEEWVLVQPFNYGGGTTQTNYVYQSTSNIVITFNFKNMSDSHVLHNVLNCLFGLLSTEDSK